MVFFPGMLLYSHLQLLEERETHTHGGIKRERDKLLVYSSLLEFLTQNSFTIYHLDIINIDRSFSNSLENYKYNTNNVFSSYGYRFCSFIPENGLCV